MLSKTKLSLLKQLVQSASTEEIIWAKGYLSGFLDKNQFGISLPIPELLIPATVKPLIIYGTETGNSKKVAIQLLANFKKNKIKAKAVDAFQFDTLKLEKESLVLFVMSTQGEGEFPQNAQSFYEKLKASTFNLEALSFAVFGLGDSSYPLFNQAGVLLDEILAEKGAKRILPLVKADIDYTETAAKWESDLQRVFHNRETTEAHVKSTSSVSNKTKY